MARGYRIVKKNDIKAQKIFFFGFDFLNNDHQPNVVTNQGHLPLYHVPSFYFLSH